MRAIIKGKWFVFIGWIIIAAVLMMTAPNMGELVREKGQLSVPDGYSSSLAAKWIKEANEQENKEHERSAVLVFYQKDGLTAQDKREIEQAVQALEKKKSELHITEIVSPLSNKELEKARVQRRDDDAHFDQHRPGRTGGETVNGRALSGCGRRQGRALFHRWVDDR